MDCFRVFSDAQGETHFEDLELAPKAADPLESTGAIALLGQWAIASVVFIHRPEAAGPTPWHTVKQRQFVIRLTGEMEIEVSDGSLRRAGPGSVMLAEDTTGKGHRASRLWGDGVSAIVRLPRDTVEE
jgi:hypothetical protein